MKYTHIITLVLSAIFIVACGNPREGEHIEKARKDVANVIKELPKLKEEIKAIEKKSNTKQVAGIIKVAIGDISKTLTQFSGKKSSITFNPSIAKYKIYTDKSRKERVIITLNNKDLYNLKDRTFMASLHGDNKDLELMNTRLQKHIQFEYYNENTQERYNSHEGTITLDEFTNSTLKFTYSANGAIGDWRKPNLAPMQLKIDLNYNFLSYDFRKNQN